jgi:pilus assembly protein CpaB
MNRSTRTLVVVGIAVVLAALASYSVYRAIKNLPEKKVPIAERFTVVAAQNVAVGMLLTKELVKVIPWPANSPVQGGFASPDEVIGRGVTSMLALNEPIVETKLAPRAAGGGLPPLITPGMRAMTVKVNDVIGVAGFTQQGTRVDVVVILRGGGTEGASRTVLSNIQVLSSNRRIDQEQARAGTGADQSVVTLLVTPEDGEKLALATSQGQIVLALRNPLDTAATDTKGVRMSALMSGGEPPPAPRTSRPRAAPPPPQPEVKGPHVVTGIRGSKVTQEIIKCCQ